MSARARLTLVYDGECGFCIRSLAWVRAADRAGQLEYVPSQDPQVRTRFPMLATADFDHAMYAVSDTGEVYRGFFAFRRIALALPRLRVLAPIFYFPGASIVGPRVYAWVDRYRKKGGCGGTHCELTPAAEPRRRR